MLVLEIAAGVVLGLIGVVALMTAPFLAWDAVVADFRRLKRAGRPPVQRPAWADAKPRPAQDWPPDPNSDSLRQ